MLDNISGGRVSYVAAIGYRPVEYEMYGVDFHRRGKDRRGEARGPAPGQDRRTVRARGPAHPRHPAAGHAGRADGRCGAAAARRPRAAPGASGSASSPRAAAASSRACTQEAAGPPATSPGMCIVPAARLSRPPCSWPTTSTARGPSSGPYLMHDVRSYAAWNEGNTHTASLSFVRDGRGAAGRGPQPPDHHRRRGGRAGPRRRRRSASTRSSAGCRPRSPGATCETVADEVMPALS